MNSTNLLIILAFLPIMVITLAFIPTRKLKAIGTFTVSILKALPLVGFAKALAALRINAAKKQDEAKSNTKGK